MSKEINKYLNLSIVMSILFVILGIILVISPESSINTIAYMLASFLLVYGTFNFIDSFTINPIFFFFQMVTSILSFLLGICVFLNPSIFESIIPIVLGIFFIISGAFSSRLSFVIKNIDSGFILSLISSILMIICGVILIINPTGTIILITTFIGIMLIVYSISNIIDMSIFKSKVKEIDKYFDKLLK